MNNYNPNIHHRKSIRLKGYDYSQAGLYFITICCEHRKCHFGKIDNGEMVLNEYGQIAYDEWMKTPQLRPHIELDAFIVMPNHIHGILKINDIRRGELHSPDNGTPDIDSFNNDSPENGTPDNQICELHPSHNDSFNNNSPDNQKGKCNSPLRSPSNNVGAIVRGYKSSVTKQLGLMGFNEKLWQRNYYEHIIRNEQSYQNISNYIINNPSKWVADKFHRI